MFFATQILKKLETETSGPEKMENGKETDGLVTKIGEGVFAKFSSILDLKLDQTDH